MNIVQIQGSCRRWTGRAVCLLATLGLLGCSSSSKSASSSRSVTGQQNSDPTSALSVLPKETIARIESTSAGVALPISRPFETNSELSRVYSEWYRKGYAFAFVTGNEQLRDQVSRAELPETERVKILGWFDGNSAGGLARRLNDIDSAVGRVMTNRSHTP